MNRGHFWCCFLKEVVHFAMFYELCNFNLTRLCLSSCRNCFCAFFVSVDCISLISMILNKSHRGCGVRM
ncbi:hypothetical protein XELAEV_18012287mg [Xenopus laevis]|uniref:Uncharacterized protein n=1 Tax=Xenopus laevis TaxID=8355 RepID=A0A974DNR8_XENLA|nr:hypothetical protein XELAEV_18012287mg [Xenopus laevis]